MAAIVINSSSEILLCQRSDKPEAWQPPQGGIEEGETADVALYRELEEEIGSRDVEVLDQLPEKLSYDWPERLYSRGYHGQTQDYFLVRLAEGVKIVVNEEFSSYQWVSIIEFNSLVSGFKSDVYKKALELFISRNQSTFNY